MKTTVSLPDALWREVEAAAKDLGLSPGGVIGTALEAFLARRREEAVMAALNRSLARSPDEVDPLVQHFALETLKREEWEEQEEQTRRSKMRVTVSLPADLCKEADRAAGKLRVSRSALIRMALEDYIKRGKASEIRRRLNKSYTENPPEPDPFLDYLVLEGIKRTP